MARMNSNVIKLAMDYYPKGKDPEQSFKHWSDSQIKTERETISNNSLLLS